MSEYDREIVEAIRKAAGTELKDDVKIIQATVTNVYTPKSYTCDCIPINGDSTDHLLGVSLSAKGNDSFILVPAKGSTVLIAVSTKNNPPYIVGYDTLQGVICVVPNPGSTNASQLIIQNGIVQFNDGSNGGLVISANVLSNLNAIITYSNSVFTAIASALNGIVGGSGSGVTTAAANTPTFENMENAKVKHGV